MCLRVCSLLGVWIWAALTHRDVLCIPSAIFDMVQRAEAVVEWPAKVVLPLECSIGIEVDQPGLRALSFDRFRAGQEPPGVGGECSIELRTGLTEALGPQTGSAGIPGGHRTLGLLLLDDLTRQDEPYEAAAL